MRLPPLFLVCAAGAVTFAFSQTLSPTARAQSIAAAPALRVSVQTLTAKQTPGGIEVTGRVVNTGRQALTYPSVVCVFSDASGREVGRTNGYFTAGPVEPGQSAEIRAVSPQTPAFAAVSVRLREAGQTVTVQPPVQSSASRRMTSR